MEELPPGWEERWDAARQRPYYVDHRRRLTTWERPALPAYPAPPLARQHSAPPGASSSSSSSSSSFPSSAMPSSSSASSSASSSSFAGRPPASPRALSQAALRRSPPPPVPSRAAKPAVLLQRPPPPPRSQSPAPAPASLQDMPLFEPTRASDATASQSSKMEECEKLVHEMNNVAQAVDLGVMSSRDAQQVLERCLRGLEALKLGASDEQLRRVIQAAGELGQEVGTKLKAKQAVEHYCESLQRVHVLLNQVNERARERSGSFDDLNRQLGKITLSLDKLKRLAPSQLDDATITYAAKIDRFAEQVMHSVNALGGSDTVQTTPISGSDLPDVSGSSDDTHSFALVSTVSPTTCALCGKLRTSLKCFQCGSCHQVVHKHCLPLVSSMCTHSRSLTASQDSRFDVDMSNALLEGFLWKQSRNGKWSLRYFILPDCKHVCALFYFEDKPSDRVSVPLGCIHLDGASMQVARATNSDDHGEAPPVHIAIESTGLGRRVLLATDSQDSANEWITTAMERLKVVEDAVMAEWVDVPRMKRPRGEVTLQGQLLGARVFDEVECFDADQCGLPYTVTIDCLRGNAAKLKPNGFYFVVVRGYYAGKVIFPEATTQSSATGSWGTQLELTPLLFRLPSETVLMFSLYETAPADTGVMRKMMFGEEGVTTCLGHAHLSLCDPCGFVRTGGAVELKLTEGEGSAVHFALDNAVVGSLPMLRIILPDAPLPICYGSFPSSLLLSLDEISFQTDKVSNILDPIDPKVPNPLAMVSQENLRDAWNNRLVAKPEILDWVFLGCNFLDPEHRKAASELCRQTNWNLPLFVALHLIGFSFSNVEVRARAMFSLCSSLNNESLKELANVILYSVRFELHNWSPLIEILLKRIIVSNELVFSFFWAAFAQSDPTQPLGHRFRAFADALLQLVPKAKVLQARDAFYVEQIIALTRDDTRRTSMPQLLRARKWDEFVLPTSTKHKVLGVDMENSRTIGSSAGPVFFRFFSHKDVPDFIVKSGDDIRQDEIVLLIGKLMNRIWAAEGLPAELLLYQCTSVATKVGFIEVVPGCTGLGDIQGNSVSGAFKRSAIKDWFMAGIKADPSLSWKSVVDNYVRSLAAACVFEYVMGFGDRHCDNILFQPSGKVFHIDFGMILGKDYGVAATLPFTLTQQMLEVIGGKEGDNWHRLVSVATRAFLAVRRHHVLITSLVMIIVGGKLPSCQKIEDVKHLRDAFCIQMTEKQASEHFKKLMHRVSDSLASQSNDAMHNFYMKFIAKKAYK